ncbi:hypothetical protein FRC06_010073, partial [Ceratobasidium sp. 370]
YIHRFGPALLFSTERFESFNGVFRAASTFSNRQAPSRDIAQRFGDLERVKHVYSGGYWYEDGRWVQAGDQVLKFASTNTIFRELLGIPKKKAIVPGSIELLPKTSVKSQVRATPQSWTTFTENTAIFGHNPPESNAKYFHILSASSHSGDTIQVGTDILSQDNQFAHVLAIFGCVLSDNRCTYFIAAQLYALDPAKHPVLDLPVVSRSETLCFIPVPDIICIVNLQHDCMTDQACTNTQVVLEVEEREETTKTGYRVRHSNRNAYFINLHALHNTQLVRQALPAHLYAQRTWFTEQDRSDIFTSAVEKLSTAKIQKARLAAAKKAAKGVVSEAMEEIAGDAEVDEETGLEVQLNVKKRRAGGRIASGNRGKKPV